VRSRSHHESDTFRPQVAVVGGGIAGLAAAWFLRQGLGDAVRVTVLEGSETLGGKLSLGEIAGLPIDDGAESMLARRPEAVELARAVGLGPAIVHPETADAAIWSRGRLRPFPSGQLMGAPGDLRALAASGLLSPAGLARAALDQVLPRTEVTGDVRVADYVGARVGREVVERLVEPLLGGVYAGQADQLSLEMTVPQLAEAAKGERSLVRAVRRLLAAADRDRPVFAGLRGGIGRLPDAVAAASGADVVLRTTVRELRRRPRGWRLTLGPTSAAATLDVDAVVLAVPARPASRLLAADVPAAAAELAGLDYASLAVVPLAYRPSAFPTPLVGSGFLVPALEKRAVKAVTFNTVKWRWLADVAGDVVVVRCSIGRHGEEHYLQRSDEELLSWAVDDIAAATGAGERPIDARVVRWGGCMPQYQVGHRERMARLRRAVAAAGGLVVCGAAYDGVGVATCVASGQRAAALLEQELTRSGEWAHG
jgi:oxygen-dependent protoporphyrinogen oxidase